MPQFLAYKMGLMVVPSPVPVMYQPFIKRAVINIVMGALFLSKGSVKVRGVKI